MAKKERRCRGLTTHSLAYPPSHSVRWVEEPVDTSWEHRLTEQTTYFGPCRVLLRPRRHRRGRSLYRDRRAARGPGQGGAVVGGPKVARASLRRAAATARMSQRLTGTKMQQHTGHGRVHEHQERQRKCAQKHAGNMTLVARPAQVAKSMATCHRQRRSNADDGPGWTIGGQRPAPFAELHSTAALTIAAAIASPKTMAISFP